MVQPVARKPLSLFATAPSRPEPSDQAPGLSRHQLVERIMGRNNTATEDYLGSFSDRSLERYLAHLETADQPRGGRWERNPETPAIVARETDF